MHIPQGCTLCSFNPCRERNLTARCKLAHTLWETGSHGVLQTHIHSHTYTSASVVYVCDSLWVYKPVRSIKMYFVVLHSVSSTCPSIFHIMTGGNLLWQRLNWTEWEQTELYEERLVQRMTPRGMWSSASLRLWVTASRRASSWRQSLSLMLTWFSSGGGCHLLVSLCSGSSDQWGIWGPVVLLSITAAAARSRTQVAKL